MKTVRVLKRKKTSWVWKKIRGFVERDVRSDIEEIRQSLDEIRRRVQALDS